jgi:hypothetical protein
MSSNENNGANNTSSGSNSTMSTVEPFSAAGLITDQTMISDMGFAGMSYSSMGLTDSQVNAINSGTAQIDWSGSGYSEKY